MKPKDDGDGDVHSGEITSIREAYLRLLKKSKAVRKPSNNSHFTANCLPVLFGFYAAKDEID